MVFQGAKNGSRTNPGRARIAVAKKKFGHPIEEDHPPDGATMISRLKATKLDNNAYWVAENLWLHKLFKKATKAADSSPAQKFSALMAASIMP